MYSLSRSGNTFFLSPSEGSDRFALTTVIDRVWPPSEASMLQKKTSVYGASEEYLFQFSYTTDVIVQLLLIVIKTFRLTGETLI